MSLVPHDSMHVLLAEILNIKCVRKSTVSAYFSKPAADADADADEEPWKRRLPEAEAAEEAADAAADAAAAAAAAAPPDALAAAAADERPNRAPMLGFKRWMCVGVIGGGHGHSTLLGFVVRTHN